MAQVEGLDRISQGYLFLQEMNINDNLIEYIH